MKWLEKKRKVTQKSFKEGARGFIVKDIQMKLNEYSGLSGGIVPDRSYGKNTSNLVSLAKKQLNYINEDGSVIEEDFYEKLMGHSFPDVFHLSLNIVSAFEATYFGGLVADEKHNTVYCGIIGFSKEEIYRLLCMLVKRFPESLNLIKDEGEKKRLSGILFDYKEEIAIRNLTLLLLGKHKFWRSVFSDWGNLEIMRELQMQMAKKYWEDSQFCLKIVAPDLLGVDRAKALFFDCQVQNGGVRIFMSGKYNKFIEKEAFITNEEKMLFIVDGVVQSSLPRWQQDVRNRKTLFAYGVSTVHGRNYQIANFGFE